jgi:hypothetical protein
MLVRPHGPLLGALLLSALGLGIGSCDDQEEQCRQICQRARRCRPAVTEALRVRLPSRSPFMKTVRRELPDRIVTRLLRSCEERCAALWRTDRWRMRLQRCHGHKACTAFATCIAPALEP